MSLFSQIRQYKEKVVNDFKYKGEVKHLENKLEINRLKEENQKRREKLNLIQELDKQKIESKKLKRLELENKPLFKMAKGISSKIKEAKKSNILNSNSNNNVPYWMVEEKGKKNKKPYYLR